MSAIETGVTAWGVAFAVMAAGTVVDGWFFVNTAVNVVGVVAVTRTFSRSTPPPIVSWRSTAISRMESGVATWGDTLAVIGSLSSVFGLSTGHGSSWLAGSSRCATRVWTRIVPASLVQTFRKSHQLTQPSKWKIQLNGVPVLIPLEA